MQAPSHPMRRQTDLLSATPSERWWRRQWNGFVRHLTNTKAPMGLVYLGTAVILFGWWAVQHQQETIVSSQRRADLRVAAQALYQSDLQQWAKASSDYALCLDSVSRSDLNRQQWQDIADGLEELGAVVFAERVRNGPVLSNPPRLVSDCHNPGPPPTAPDFDNEGSPLSSLPATVEFTSIPG